MRVFLKQVEKTSLTATFEIVRGGKTVGSAEYRSFAESGQGNWSGRFGGREIGVEYDRPRAAAIGPDSQRRYRVVMNSEKRGEIVREGNPVATLDGLTLTRVTLALDDCELVAYPFSCGRKGYRYPIFRNGIQIAEIFKECKVQDDLHDFEIAIEDEAMAVYAIAMCCYIFCQSWWRLGPARRHHKHYYIQKKTKPGTDLYDSSFFGRVEE